MNVENWDCSRAVPFLRIFVSNFRYCVFAVNVSMYRCYTFILIITGCAVINGGRTRFRQSLIGMRAGLSVSTVSANQKLDKIREDTFKKLLDKREKRTA